MAISFLAILTPLLQIGEEIGPPVVALILILLMLLVAAIVCVVLVLLAVVLALNVLLVMIAIVSSSVAVGFIKRSAGSGFRLFFLQLGGAVGIPCGIGSAWILSAFIDTPFHALLWLIAGTTAGLVSGVGVAWLFNLAWGAAVATMVRWFSKWRKRKQPQPASA